MTKQLDLQLLINRRIKIGAVIVLLSGILLILRLFHVQIVSGEQFEWYADANRLFAVRIPPERGVLLDRYGQLMVNNAPAYGLIEDPQARYTSSVPISHEQALKIKADGKEFVEYSLQRQYLWPESTAHVVGYTGPVTSEELLADRSFDLNDVTGKLGMERYLEQKLRGRNGMELYEVDAFGRRQRLIRTELGNPGESIATTLDPYLSQVAYEAMGDQRGAVVVMDAQTGELLVVVSTPTFNATTLSTRQIDQNLERKRRQEVQEFFTHPHNLFFNRAISGTYPPGSIFKPITALAALEAGAIDQTTLVRDEGKLEVGEYSYANWFYLMYGQGEGEMALERALARSNDIFFYKAAEWTGPTKIAEMAKLFGFGQRTGLEMSGESVGLVPDPAWKEKEIGERWFLGNTYHFGIGQGDLLVTPLQMTQMTQALANDGAKCIPTLLKRQVSNNGMMDQTICTQLGINEDHLTLVLDGLIDACAPGGTASVFFDRNASFIQSRLTVSEQLNQGAIACKTGTAEFGGTDERNRKKTHGWFTAIVKTEPTRWLPISSELELELEELVLVDDQQKMRDEWLSQVQQHGFPKTLAIAVLVESDELQPYKEGSREAAPIVKSLLDWMESGVSVSP